MGIGRRAPLARGAGVHPACLRADRAAAAAGAGPGATRGGSQPGDIVADLFGRGGWIARAAIDRQRRAVLPRVEPADPAARRGRPPAARPAAPRRRVLVPRRIAAPANRACGSRSTTCSRRNARPAAGASPIDELEWADGEPAKVHYRCQLCRDQQGRSEHQAVEPTDADARRRRRDIGAGAVRKRLRERFPVPDGGDDLIERPARPAHGPAARRARGDSRSHGRRPPRGAGRERAAPRVPARGPAGEPAGPRRREDPTLQIAAGRVQTKLPERWHERNPWLAFEDGFRLVRGFVQRLESGALGPLEARLGRTCEASWRARRTRVVRVLTPGALETFAQGGSRPRAAHPAGARPAAGALQPGAARRDLPRHELGAGSGGGGAPAARAAARPGRPRALVVAGDGAAALAGSGRPASRPGCARGAAAGPGRTRGAGRSGPRRRRRPGYRVVEARLTDPEDEVGGVVELVPPGGILPPGPLSRSNVTAGARPGRPRRPGARARAGAVRAAAERIEARPFSPREAAATVLRPVEVLRERGEPASFERLLGEILVGLDRSGSLRRLLATEPSSEHRRRGRRRPLRRPRATTAPTGRVPASVRTWRRSGRGGGARASGRRHPPDDAPAHVRGARATQRSCRTRARPHPRRARAADAAPAGRG